MKNKMTQLPKQINEDTFVRGLTEYSEAQKRLLHKLWTMDYDVSDALDQSFSIHKMWTIVMAKKYGLETKPIIEVDKKVDVPWLSVQIVIQNDDLSVMDVKIPEELMETVQKLQRLMRGNND